MKASSSSQRPSSNQLSMSCQSVMDPVVALTKEDQQTHADGQDGAGAEGGQPLTFDLAQLAAPTPEAIGTAAAEAVS